MADGGGTFRCATMLCGNNAQTNDSAVPTVITRGTRSFFPLLNPPSRPPSNPTIPLRVYPPFLSFLVSLVRLSIHVCTLPFSPHPPPLSLYPFLIALIAKSTHFRNDDWSTHPPYLVHSPLPARLSLRSGKELGHQSASTRSFCRIFFVFAVMEGPWKRRSILQQIWDRCLSVDRAPLIHQRPMLYRRISG